MERYSDTEITFYLQTYRDQSYAYYRATQIRALYPGSRLIVRSDGGGRAPLPWELIDAEFFNEARLFPVANGGMVVQRMLQLFALAATSYLIKVDPDTAFHRRLRYLPDEDGLFGSVQEFQDCRSIQGGCLGMTNTAALRILDSELLLAPELAAPDPRIGGYMTILANRAARLGLTSFDWVLGWVATRLDLGIHQFPEVCCEWQLPPENPDCMYAITHPDVERDRWLATSTL